MEEVQTLDPRSDLVHARAALDVMLVALVAAKGSDLHLTVGAPPTIRVDGGLRYLPDYDTLNPTDTATLVRSAVTGDVPVPGQPLHPARVVCRDVPGDPAPHQVP